MNDAKMVGEKAVAALCEPFNLIDKTARIGASVGAAVFPNHANTAETLVKKADQAMYTAKSKGKNTCVMVTVNDHGSRDDVV